MERLGWTHARIRRKGEREWSFVKGTDDGWLCVRWPHGPQAPAKIESDFEINPTWKPKYADEVGTEVGTEGRDTVNPCGSSVFNTVPTCPNLNEEINTEQHFPTPCGTGKDKDEEGGNLRFTEVCGGKVGTAAKERFSTSKANGLGVVQPSLSQPRDTATYPDDNGCSDVDELPDEMNGHSYRTAAAPASRSEMTT